MSAHKEFEGGDVGIEVNWVKGNARGGKKRGGGNGGGGRDRDRGDEQELRENRGERSQSDCIDSSEQEGLLMKCCIRVYS